MLFHKYTEVLQSVVIDSQLQPVDVLKKLLTEFLRHISSSTALFNENQERELAVKWLKLLEENATISVINEFKQMVATNQIPKNSALRYCISLYLTLFPQELSCAIPPTSTDQGISHELLSGEAVFDSRIDKAIDNAISMAERTGSDFVYYPRKSFYDLVESFASLIPSSSMITIIDHVLDIEFTDRFAPRPFTKEAIKAVNALAPFLPPDGKNYVTTELCSKIMINIRSGTVVDYQLAMSYLSILTAFIPNVPQSHYKNIQQVIDLIVSRKDKLHYEIVCSNFVNFISQLNAVVSIPQDVFIVKTLEPPVHTQQTVIEQGDIDSLFRSMDEYMVRNKLLSQSPKLATGHEDGVHELLTLLLQFKDQKNPSLVARSVHLLCMVCDTIAKIANQSDGKYYNIYRDHEDRCVLTEVTYLILNNVEQIDVTSVVTLQNSLLVLIKHANFNSDNINLLKNAALILAKLYKKLAPNERAEYESHVFKLMFSFGAYTDVSHVFFDELARLDSLSPAIVNQIIDYYTHCQSNKTIHEHMIARFARFLPDEARSALANKIFEVITSNENAEFYFNSIWPQHVTQFFTPVPQLMIFEFVNSCIPEASRPDDSSISSSLSLTNFSDLLSHQQRVFLLGCFMPRADIATHNFLHLLQKIQNTIKHTFSEVQPQQVIAPSPHP